jgi:ATP adenylyltransferase
VSGLDHLWAGWRGEYIATTTDNGAPDAPSAAASVEPSPSEASTGPSPGADRCVFCRILASGADDDDTNVVWRHPSGLIVALLNAYPYATGHLMVMPARHTGDLETLEANEHAELWAGVTAAVRAVKAAYRPDGCNVGANLGRAAGAGVPGHLHVHVLPRWAGDTNFMTSVANARVLPEALAVTAEKLRRAWPPGD